MSARYIVGDVFDVLATLEPDSVDLVFSSPPFLALRSYLPADHPQKHREIGSEATPADFLDTLLDVVEACDRVLAPHGSLCFELGDTFSGSGGTPSDAGKTYHNRNAAIFDGGQYVIRTRGDMHPGGDGWPDAKSLCLIPTLFAASLAYGYNMLRPERTTPRWRVRNLVVWARPNPPVGALGDKFRPATSYVTVACKSAKRYFDLDAVRHEPTAPPQRFFSHGYDRGGKGATNDRPPELEPTNRAHPAGAPPLDYWVIPTHPYPGSHYATFPPDLVVKPVASMCPQKVCRVCGEPSRRMTEPTEWEHREHPLEREGIQRGGLGTHGDRRADPTTLGWSDCGHDNYRTGTVLDPFAGSGTTLAVATGHGRDAIGIDLDGRNADLALDRVGAMFCEVEYLTTEGAA